MPRLSSTRRARGGMTLVEVLIVITIMGLVAGAVMSLLTQQQRLYRDTNEMLGVRRELRASSGMLPTETRGISSIGGDVYLMRDSAFYFAANIGSAIVCKREDHVLEIPPTDLARHTLASWYTPPAAGDTVFVFDDGTETGSQDDSWYKVPIESFTEISTTCAAGEFLDAADAGKKGWRIIVPGSWPAIPTTVQTGAVLRIARPVRYSLFQPTAGGDWYLGFAEWQGMWSNPDVVGGPFLPFDSATPANSGVRFRYFDDAGNPLTADTQAEREALARVDVVLRARAAVNSALTKRPLQDSVLFRMAIRNRI